MNTNKKFSHFSYINILHITELHESKLSQNPTYIHIQATCYGLTECEQARYFSHPVLFLAGCVLRLQRKDQSFYSLSQKVILERILKEPQT